MVIEVVAFSTILVTYYSTIKGAKMNDVPETPTEEKPARKQKSEAAMSGMVATYALLFAFVFTAVIVWIAA